MALNTEVWLPRIEHNLFLNNEFLTISIDDSGFVSNKTVHIPNAGAAPAVTIDGAYTAGGEDVVQITDRDKTYNINEFRMPPFVIRDAQKKELSYSKMDSELYEFQSKLSETVANKMLHNWGATGTATLVDGVTTNANILRTTGVAKNTLTADRIQAPAHLAGATGNRLAFGMYDVLQAQTFLNGLDVPMSDRSMLLDSIMYAQLIGDMSATQYSDFSAQMDPKSGVVGRLFGFNIYMRSKTLAYTNAATPVKKAFGAAGAATDNSAALFWWKGAVSRAVGGTEVYAQENAPQHYGDVLSILVRAGGAPRRDTELGIGAIVQGVAA